MFSPRVFSQLSVEEAQKRIGKFDPNKKISISSEAPPMAKDYDVTYDPKIGTYLIYSNSK